MCSKEKRTKKKNWCNRALIYVIECIRIDTFATCRQCWTHASALKPHSSKIPECCIQSRFINTTAMNAMCSVYIPHWIVWRVVNDDTWKWSIREYLVKSLIFVPLLLTIAVWYGSYCCRRSFEYYLVYSMERKNRRRRKIERRKKSSAAITAKYNQTVIIDESDSHTGERDAQWKRNQPKTKEEEIQKSHRKLVKYSKSNHGLCQW